jgi:hypothetical protein
VISLDFQTWLIFVILLKLRHSPSSTLKILTITKNDLMHFHQSASAPGSGSPQLAVPKRKRSRTETGRKGHAVAFDHSGKRQNCEDGEQPSSDKSGQAEQALR